MRNSTYDIEQILYCGFIFAIAISPKLFGPIIGSVWSILCGIGLSCTTIITAHRYGSGDVQLFMLSNILIHASAGLYLAIMGMFYGSIVLLTFSSMLSIVLFGFLMINSHRPIKIRFGKTYVVWNSDTYHFRQDCSPESKSEFVVV